MDLRSTTLETDPSLKELQSNWETRYTEIKRETAILNNKKLDGSYQRKKYTKLHKNIKSYISKITHRDFPGGPVVKNPPANTGYTGSILGQGTRSHMPWGNCVTTTESALRVHALQEEKPLQ